MVLHMLLIIVPEALQSVHYQPGRIPPDGAVGGIHNAAGCFLDDADGAHVGGPVQHLGNELGQLPQTDAAGHALAAGLCMAQLQNDRDISTGHRPGGLAAIRRSTSR